MQYVTADLPAVSALNSISKTRQRYDSLEATFSPSLFHSFEEQITEKEQGFTGRVDRLSVHFVRVAKLSAMGRLCAE